MKKVVFNQYGGPEVLRVIEDTQPIPKSGEVLVAVKALAVTVADRRIRAAVFPKGFALIARLVFGLSGPRQPVLGTIFSGVVEAVGTGVSEFAPGDEVCGSTGTRLGAYAEYIAISSTKSIVKKPSLVAHVDAVAVLFGSTAALYFLRDRAHVRAGDLVAINGATGAVGTAAVQLATYYGASVTAVVRQEAHAMMTFLGATKVIDVRNIPLTASTSQFDIILDTVGNLSLSTAVHLLTATGRLILIVASLGQMIRGGKKVITGVATEKKDDIAFIISLVEAGYLKAVISATYEFDAMAAAHTYAELPNTIGVVVVTV